MGTDDKKIAWDKEAKLTFSAKDCAISSAIDSFKEAEIYYDSTATSGITSTYKPVTIRYAYDDYPVTKTITKEQEQIETLIRAVTNLIKEVEELKKITINQNDRIVTLEEENKILRNSMEEMYVEMIAIKDKTMILEARKADIESVSALASSC